MRKAMEKLMGVKKDGGQEVLITLGLVAVGVVLLLMFSNTANAAVGAVLTKAEENVRDILGLKRQAGSVTPPPTPPTGG